MQLRSAVFWIVAVLLVLWTGQTQAQYMTNVALTKRNFMAYERVDVTVTISNRSGNDVVMRGPNGMSWLTFDITDPRGRKMLPMQAMVEENFLFKSGTTIRRVVNLSDAFSFGDAGNYVIGASVYHPGSSQFYASNKAFANVTTVRPFWEQNYGVPKGMPNAGQVRKYSMSVMRDSTYTYLYARLEEERTGLNIGTYSLGTVIMVSPPQIQVDLDNQLHVFFMTRPRIYVHVTISPNGKEVQRTYFQEAENSRPQMIVEGNQSIGVRGGVIYDPDARLLDQPSTGRSIGVKPPGL